MKFIKVYILSLLIGALGLVNGQSKIDRLASLRTSKKIISISSLPSNTEFAIQIIALKYPAEDPDFFNNVEEAREFECADGYVRYSVGSYDTYEAAKADLDEYKNIGYLQAFVINLQDLELNGESTNRGFRPDPNKTYTIQLSAYRFPVYLSHFEGLDNVLEFYMEDQIYRYTVGRYTYDEAVNELSSIKAAGYKDAYVTELDAYLPYQIE